MLACICCTSHLSDFLPHRQEAKVALLLLSPHGLSRRLLYILRHSILDQRAGEMTENMPPQCNETRLNIQERTAEQKHAILSQHISKPQFLHHGRDPVGMPAFSASKAFRQSCFSFQLLLPPHDLLQLQPLSPHCLPFHEDMNTEQYRTNIAISLPTL